MAAPTGRGPTTLRAFRLEDEIYDPAQEIAAIRGETLADVVRRAFVDYAREGQNLPQLEDYPAVAETLGVDVGDLQALVRSGDIPYRQVGRRSVRFTVGDVDEIRAYLRNNRAEELHPEAKPVCEAANPRRKTMRDNRCVRADLHNGRHCDAAGFEWKGKP